MGVEVFAPAFCALMGPEHVLCLGCGSPVPLPPGCYRSASSRPLSPAILDPNLSVAARSGSSARWA